VTQLTIQQLYDELTLGGNMAQVVKKTEGSEVAEVSDLEKLMQGDAGKGVSNRSEDNLVPQISILQPLSPEVLDGPANIAGAKAGDFLVGKRIIAGREGFWFQPCYVDQTWLEFTPLDRGGGFVAQHEFNGVDRSGNAVPPQGAVGYGRQKYRMANGNEVVHYRQLAGILWTAEAGQSKGLEHVIAFKSTGHTVMRDWMTKAGQLRFPNGDQHPLFGAVYKVTTEQRRNASGQWYVVKVDEPLSLLAKEAAAVVGDATKAYHMGEALNAAFESREKQAARVIAAEVEVDEEKIPL